MMSRPLDIIFAGLTLSSSWGNGHATTYRALLRGLRDKGHRITFLERDVPWYASHRDMPNPDFCGLALYEDLEGLARYRGLLERADAVVIGSYVPEGAAVIDLLASYAIEQLCFYDIDTPVTLSRMLRGEEEHIARRQVPLFDLYYSFSGGEVLDRLEEEFGARKAAALYCSVQPDRYRPTGDAIRWDLGYLGTYSEDRQPALERLLIEPARRLPHRRFVVAGAQYPDGIDWPDNVERIDHLPPDEHPRFYSRQRFTLNVTRADMVAAGWSPSVRLFEAAACGTPVISDEWRGLGELFPEGEAVLMPRTSGEVIEILEEFPEPRRCEIASNARARVLACHTGAARAAEFLQALQSRLPTAIAV